jgi:hypothetical protein
MHARTQERLDPLFQLNDDCVARICIVKDLQIDFQIFAVERTMIKPADRALYGVQATAI